MADKLGGMSPSGDRHLSCQKVRQMSSEYLEGTLGPKRLWEFNYHAERCKGCDAFVSSLRATIRALNSLPHQNAPEELKRRLREQYPGGSINTSAGS
ncbi:MAG: zf-HC2 domain-containing protein [Chloroflexi bacterium]|nr:zf-HC2 domain-containing protein [Chloroflexota bacterium]